MVSKRLSNSMAMSKSRSISLFRPSIPGCFRPIISPRRICPPSEPPLPSSTPPSNTSCSSTLSTSLYHTDFGLFTLTWSRSLLGHSLHLDLNSSSDSPCRLSPRSPSTSLFHLHLKSFFSWQRKGCKKITSRPDPIQIFWDFRRSKFGSRPEPESRFYLAVVISGEIALLIGDSNKEALKRINLDHHKRKEAAAEKQVLFLRREHFFGNRLFVTKARFGGADKEIRIEYCNEKEDPTLCFSFDSKTVLKVCHLKWKFRGNERIEIENVVVNISWDVYNWLFDKRKSNNNDIDGHGVFLFNFEKRRFKDEEFEDYNEIWNKKQSMIRGNHDAVMCYSASFGTMSGFEKKKLRRKERLMKSSKSLSSSSTSSTTSSGCNSVMEWASMEEKDLESSTGFSLLVYAWKS